LIVFEKKKNPEHFQVALFHHFKETQELQISGIIIPLPLLVIVSLIKSSLTYKAPIPKTIFLRIVELVGI